MTHVNPTYAHIRHNDGRESTVSLSDLAPCPKEPNKLIAQSDPEISESTPETSSDETLPAPILPTTDLKPESPPPILPEVRRSERVKRKP